MLKREGAPLEKFYKLAYDILSAETFYRIAYRFTSDYEILERYYKLEYDTAIAEKYHRLLYAPPSPSKVCKDCGSSSIIVDPLPTCMDCGVVQSEIYFMNEFNVGTRSCPRPRSKKF